MQVLQVQLEVGSDPAEVGRARRWVRARLAGSGIAPDEPLTETLVLIVSELVTNAVVHTGCPAVLRIVLPQLPERAVEQDRSGLPRGAGRPDGAASSGCRGEPEPPAGMVRVEVADTSVHPPRPRFAEGDETGGRGLALVDGLADRWGWEPNGAGKRIWCELDRCAAKHQASAVYEGLVAYEAV